MQIIYRNEGSLPLRCLMLLAGVLILAVSAADYFALVPALGVNQYLDLTLLLVGSVLALVGVKEVSGFVREIAVNDSRALVVSRALGSTAVPADALRALTIYASGKDARRMALSAAGGALDFPMTAFAADRFAETIKAINPAVTVERRA